MYDFVAVTGIAITGITVSVWLLYLSYSQFIRVSDTIGLGNLSNNLNMIQYKSENVSFATYAVNSLTSITFAFIEQRRQYLTTAIHDVIAESIPDFTQQAMEICIHQTHTHISEFMHSIVRTMITPEITNTCISKITQINIENILPSQHQRVRSLITQLDPDISQIRSILIYALQIGYTSTAYLSWRMALLMNMSYKRNHINKCISIMQNKYC